MSRPLHELFRADDDTPNGRAEALAETQGNGVEALAVFFQGAGVRGDGFPEAGAVEVEFDVVLVGEVADGAAGGNGEDAAVERVF